MINTILEKKSTSFVVESDFEILDKLNEADDEYKKNGISFSVLDCYNEHTSLINNMEFLSKVLEAKKGKFIDFEVSYNNGLKKLKF